MGVTDYGSGKFESNVTATPAISAIGTHGADGIDVTCDSGTGIQSISTDGPGIQGFSTNGTGVAGSGLDVGIDGGSNSGIGVRGISANGTGVWAQSINGGIGLIAVGGGAGLGVPPVSQAGILADGGPNIGIIARSDGSTGLHAVGGGASFTTPPITPTAIFAEGGTGIGLHAVSGTPSPVASPPTQAAIFAESDLGYGIYSSSDSFTGIEAHSNSSTGIFGHSNDGFGISGTSSNSTGVSGTSNKENTDSEAGVFGSGTARNGNGVIGEANNGPEAVGVRGKSTSGFAGYFDGNVHVNGTLSKKSGGFRIDHPLDPENKYLSHSFVESPDMLNVYNGNVTTDANGDATIMLSDYFEALNQDFRYQLTVIGQFAQAIVAEEVKNNQFMVKTDQPNVRVSWQVTGVRKDHFANMHRLVVEEDKPADERGMYLHPKAHSKPETQRIEYAHGKVLKGP